MLAVIFTVIMFAWVLGLYGLGIGIQHVQIARREPVRGWAAFFMVWAVWEIIVSVVLLLPGLYFLTFMLFG